MPGRDFEEARRDAYQETCLAFIADGYRRIMAYGGTGSFTGFILQAVDRLAIDHIRRTATRRRMPASVAAMGEIEQAVFRLVHWEGMPADAALIAADTGHAADAVAKALERIRPIQPAPITMSIDDVEYLPSEDRTPEAMLIKAEEDRALEVAAEVLRDAAGSLSEAERLYLEIFLGNGEPLPAREMARLMGRPVAEIYKLKQRVMGRLKAALEKNPAVKLWRASV
jgi:RNA polymerase primary sigma factor